ncbi:MAG: hypothetical protein AAGC97_02220 [Planctomycetota bacterium]
MTIEPFVLLVATIPLLGYLLVLALVRVSGRVLITTGGRDTAAVGLAVAGMFVIGPAELFFPYSTATLLGAWVWVPLAVLYLLVISLIALTGRPRLVVYGRNAEEMFPALCRACESMDASTLANAESMQVHLPALGAHVRLEANAKQDCLTIEAFETTLPIAFWDALLAALRGQVRSTASPQPRRGILMLILTCVTIAWVTRHALIHPEELVEGFRQWLVR